MKKVLLVFFSVLLITIITLIAILSTIWLETSKFSNIISKKINQAYDNINLKFNSIKFKLDISEINLFLESLEPVINYRKIEIPTNIKLQKLKELIHPQFFGSKFQALWGVRN